MDAAAAVEGTSQDAVLIGAGSACMQEGMALT
jgi:hypothetical protein